MIPCRGEGHRGREGRCILGIRLSHAAIGTNLLKPKNDSTGAMLGYGKHFTQRKFSWIVGPS